MKKFAQLIDQLYFAYSHLEKTALLKKYFAEAPDPDRGYALAVISKALDFKYLKRTLIKELILEQIDPVLWSLSYDYVGDFSETAAHLWPSNNTDKINKTADSYDLPSLSEIVQKFQHSDRNETKNILRDLLNNSTPIERWAVLKLGTGSLRIGVSARFLKLALAEYGQKNIHEIEEVWHTLSAPYEELFAWLENKTDKPDFTHKVFFHPVMLSHPLTDKELLNIHPAEFAAEWKYDGIRVQVVSSSAGQALYSRTGEDISTAFPEVLAGFKEAIVLDGELVIKKDDKIGTYGNLQQRLNRKAPDKKIIALMPGHIVLYDMLSIDGEDICAQSFRQRRLALERWFDRTAVPSISLSPLLPFHDAQELARLRQSVIQNAAFANIEGLMLKRYDSVYIAGRPAGQWYKWKRDPLLIDAVMMYAQRGHGKRSSFYSDFTFGLWKDVQLDELLPVGKAYFGFTDEELKKLDNWVRHHTQHRYGPVREVEKALVLEIAFDAVNPSPRHKAGYALRFPRINRIRWDKPAAEADTLETLKKWLTSAL